MAPVVNQPVFNATLDCTSPPIFVCLGSILSPLLTVLYTPMQLTLVLLVLPLSMSLQMVYYVYHLSLTAPIMLNRLLLIWCLLVLLASLYTT